MESRRLYSADVALIEEPVIDPVPLILVIDDSEQPAVVEETETPTDEVLTLDDPSIAWCWFNPEVTEIEPVVDDVFIDPAICYFAEPLPADEVEVAAEDVPLELIDPAVCYFGEPLPVDAGETTGEEISVDLIDPAVCGFAETPIETEVVEPDGTGFEVAILTVSEPEPEVATPADAAAQPAPQAEAGTANAARSLFSDLTIDSQNDEILA